jgi:hypothetical protein
LLHRLDGLTQDDIDKLLEISKEKGRKAKAEANGTS